MALRAWQRKTWRWTNELFIAEGLWPLGYAISYFYMRKFLQLDLNLG